MRLRHWHRLGAEPTVNSWLVPEPDLHEDTSQDGRGRVRTEVLLIRVRDDGKLLHSLLGKPASGRVSGASGPCPLTFTSNAHAMAYSARISGFLLPAGCPKIRLLPCSSQHDRGRQALCNNRFSVGGDKELGSQPTAFHARQHRKIENPGVPTRPLKKARCRSTRWLSLSAAATGTLRTPSGGMLARPRPNQPSSQRSATQARPFGPLGIDKVASDANSIRPPTSAAAHSRVKAA